MLANCTTDSHDDHYGRNRSSSPHWRDPRNTDDADLLNASSFHA